MHAYINGLVEFAAVHPNAVGSLAFLSAFLESLVVIGAVFPGSTVLVALGALVPARAADVWLLTGLACAGAVAGDWLSYWLGRRYHGRIRSWWPFRRHPLILAKGEVFFRSRGAKSVFLARFVPGARAVVPLVAGMTDMPAGRFYVVNAAAALIWGPAHVLPGVLLGASIEMLGAAAGRLAILIILLCGVIWLAGRLAGYALSWGLPRVARARRGLRDWSMARDTRLRRRLRSMLDADWPGVGLAATSVTIPIIAFSWLDIGTHWFSGLIAGVAFGLAWIAVLAIAYARYRPHQRAPRLLAFVLVLALVAIGGFNVAYNHALDPVRDPGRPAIGTMTAASWWTDGWRDLPDRRVNLIAEFEEPFAVQWAGDLVTLQRHLVAAGWRAPPPWDLAGVLAWFGSNPSPADLPLVPKLDAGQAPALSLIRLAPDPAGGSRWVLRLWPAGRTSTAGGSVSVSIWLGAVVLEKVQQIPYLFALAREHTGATDPVQPVAEALTDGQANFRLERRDGALGPHTQLLAHGPELATVQDPQPLTLAVSASAPVGTEPDRAPVTQSTHR